MPAVVEAILLMRFPIFLHEQFEVKISPYAKQQNKYRMRTIIVPAKLKCNGFQPLPCSNNDRLFLIILREVPRDSVSLAESKISWI